MSKLFNVSLLCLLLLLTSFRILPLANLLECTEIEVSSRVVDSSNGMSNGSIELKFEKQRSDFTVHLLVGGTKKTIDSKVSTITNLSRGKYSIVITGTQDNTPYCQKFLEITIH